MRNTNLMALIVLFIFCLGFHVQAVAVQIQSDIQGAYDKVDKINPKVKQQKEKNQKCNQELKNCILTNTDLTQKVNDLQEQLRKCRQRPDPVPTPTPTPNVNPKETQQYKQLAQQHNQLSNNYQSLRIQKEQVDKKYNQLQKIVGEIYKYNEQHNQWKKQ